MRRRATRVNDPLGDPFVVEVGNLFTKKEVLEQRRPALASFERVLIVVDAEALISREVFSSAFLKKLCQVVYFFIVLFVEFTHYFLFIMNQNMPNART
jgi:hypothetical protein